MKKIYLSALIALSGAASAQNVAINNDGTNPHNSAILDIKSSTKGLLIPRVTTAQRTALVSPAKGLMVMDTTVNSLFYYNGTSWGELSSVKSNLWTTTGNDIYNTNSGNVGIGSGSPVPSALLHLSLGSSLTKGFLITGTYNDPGTFPDLPTGTRLMFYPARGAFRAGYADEDCWNNLNTGDFSTAFGYRTTASGDYSVALGLQTTASGVLSMAMGQSCVASGAHAFAMGRGGFARGSRSSAIGTNLVAKGYSSFVIGMNNDSLVSTDELGATTSTPLFIIGNGDDPTIRSNAMVVRKDGRMGISTNTPAALLHINASKDTIGLLVSGVVGVNTEIPDLGGGSRLMFIPGKAAFRAGNVLSSNWDDAFVGLYSAAVGYNTLAFGNSSWASGRNSTAEGDYSLSMGYSVIAEGKYSSAFGFLGTAEGEVSTSMGVSNTSKGYSSTVVGLYNDPILTNPETIISNTTPLFIVGNGAAADRANGFLVRKDGRVYIDPSNKNDGTITGHALMFGTSINTGEAIASKRTVGGNRYGIDFYTAHTNRMSIDNAGNVGIGITSPSQKLHVVGNICYTGSSAACSDIRYKTAIVPLTNVLTAVMSLQPIYYNWNRELFRDKGFTNERQLGFSAQEIEIFFPEVVQTDDKGYKAVDYGRLTTVLVQAMKEQQQQVDELKTENSDLKNTITDLRSRMEKIEKLLLIK